MRAFLCLIGCIALFYAKFRAPEAPSAEILAEGVDRTSSGTIVNTGESRSIVARLRSAAIKCANKFKDETETDVDCGGSCPSRCAVGMRCQRNADCLSFKCAAKTCIEKTAFVRRLSTNGTNSSTAISPSPNALSPTPAPSPISAAPTTSENNSNASSSASSPSPSSITISNSSESSRSNSTSNQTSSSNVTGLIANTNGTEPNSTQSNATSSNITGLIANTNGTEPNSTQSNATSSNVTGLIANTNGTEANSTQSNATSSNATGMIANTNSTSNSSGGNVNSSASPSPSGNGGISTTTLAPQASQSTAPYVKCSMTTPPPPPPVEKECECEVIDLTEKPNGMISPGYENTFVSVMILSCLGSFSIGTCVAFYVLQSYDSPKVHPTKKDGLIRGRSIPTAKGDRLIIEGGEELQPKHSISAIEKAAADGLETIKQDTAAKKKESADRVAQRLLSRKNKMAMKLAKSEALKTVDCFKALEMKHMAMVIGKMRLVTYEEGSILCEQGDDANEFFVCMEGTLRVEVSNQFIRTMGECDFLGEKALLGKDAVRGATVIASSKAEVFVLSRHQFELLENEGLPIKQIVSNVKHKVEQYKKDDQALEDVKANEARAQKIVKRATHVSRQSSSMTWSQEQQNGQNEEKSDDEEELIIVEDDDEGVVSL